MISLCSLCIEKLNTETTEVLSGLCVQSFLGHRGHRGEQTLVCREDLRDLFEHIFASAPALCNTGDKKVSWGQRLQRA